MIPHLDLKVDDLANFIFVQNVNNAIVHVELDGLKDSYDLFCFCIDLLCKGIVILFSGDNHKINIDSVTLDQFGIIKQKLACLGIQANLDVTPNTNDFKPCVTIVQRIDKERNTLDEYNLKITSPIHIFIISFKITHSNIAIPRCALIS